MRRYLSKRLYLLSLLFLIVPLTASRSYDPTAADMLKIVKIDASTRDQRTEIASMGVAIEEVYADYVVGLAHDEQVAALSDAGFSFSLQTMPAFLTDFPPADSDFHNLDELNARLAEMAQTYSEIATLSVIGESVEKRPLYMMRISGPQNKEGSVPGIIFLGTHHAREHLSTEVPLYLIEHLVENYNRDENITALINGREIWVMPMVNPDGSNYDVGDSPYQWWRKNRRAEGSNVYGVDLNRNYGYRWGGPGAGSSRSSQTYRGDHAFSEPETEAVKNFLEARDNITILLSYHTFSELILYPWGYTHEGIQNQRDLRVHQMMAFRMAQMTGYRPQQSSDLYITSGDTTDWAYGELGVFSFTFELYPASLAEGGFYPSARHIQSVVNNNLDPALYLADLADNPYRILDAQPVLGMTVNPQIPMHY